MASTRPRRAFGGLRPALGLLEGLGELFDLRAVDPGHLRMQERRRLLGGSELGFQLFAFGRVRVQLVTNETRRLEDRQEMTARCRLGRGFAASARSPI
jgi:hypothetical protein